MCFHQSHWSKRDQEQRDKGGDFCYQSIGRDKKPSHGIILPQGDQLQLYFIISVSQTQNMQYTGNLNHFDRRYILTFQ